MKSFIEECNVVANHLSLLLLLLLLMLWIAPEESIHELQFLAQNNLLTLLEEAIDVFVTCMAGTCSLELIKTSNNLPWPATWNGTMEGLGLIAMVQGLWISLRRGTAAYWSTTGNTRIVGRENSKVTARTSSALPDKESIRQPASGLATKKTVESFATVLFSNNIWSRIVRVCSRMPDKIDEGIVLPTRYMGGWMPWGFLLPRTLNRLLAELQVPGNSKDAVMLPAGLFLVGTWNIYARSLSASHGNAYLLISRGAAPWQQANMPHHADTNSDS
jgi:hypothetical protein